MTPSETLTAAADRLDALLADLNGPIAGQDYHWQCNRYVEGDEVNRYVEAINPDVGRALAALLRRHGQIAVGWTDTEEVFPEELRLARAILGTREDT